MTNSEEGVINWEPIKQEVRMGIGSILEATKYGSLYVIHRDPDTGKEVFFELKGVKFVPGL
jgi:hypothetical protein